jgi:hypothetical protein
MLISFRVNYFHIIEVCVGEISMSTVPAPIDLSAKGVVRDDLVLQLWLGGGITG